MKLNQKLKTPSYLATGFASVITLTACQTSPTVFSTQQYTPEQSQTMLTSAIKHTLVSGQDFIAEQQITLLNPPAKKASANDPVQMKLDCQDSHDQRLIEQMKADGIKTYNEIARLQPIESQQPYTTIRTSYQGCIASADALEKQQMLEKQRLEKERIQKEKLAQEKLTKQKKSAKRHSDSQVVEDSEANTQASYLNDVLDTSVTKHLSQAQVDNFNNFVAKSGKIIYTGNYRPFAGKIAIQADAGFTNKNLNYHYRVPVVIDIKSQALYVKPDIIMPLTALYLDNQLGMSWQDKWYKFNPPTEKQLPTKLLAKSWLMATKDSFAALPTSQFTQASNEQLTQQFTGKIHNTTQPLSLNASIIHWQQSASEQVAFYQAIIQKFITRMDNELPTDSAFLALPEADKAKQRNTWQEYKQKLIKYSDSLTADAKQQPLKKSSFSSKLTGQDVYFVLGNSQIKQIYAQNSANIMEQPATLATWVTFNPDTKNVAEAIQPATLAKLSSSIRDDNTATSNVLDGLSEINRIKNLDDSRRLFGQEPEMMKAYRGYKEMAQIKKQTDTASDKEKATQNYIP